MSAPNFSFESSTFSTILVLVVYALSNLTLSFCHCRNHRDRFNALRHVLLPLLGFVGIGIPMYYLTKPGQPTPYDWFPYAALVVLVLALVYAVVLVARDPGLSERVGSIVADE